MKKESAKKHGMDKVYGDRKNFNKLRYEGWKQPKDADQKDVRWKSSFFKIIKF